VAGEVWNRRDGKVELVAHHLDGARVAALEEALWLGPGRVTGVTGMDSLDRAEGGFSIGPTR
jgi:acylphosphatase